MSPAGQAGFHYRLSCYVGRGRVKPAPTFNLVTFTQIFIERPDDFRYAVGRMAPLVPDAQMDGMSYLTSEPIGPYLVWDMYAVEAGQMNGFVKPPPALWAGPTEEGVVMKAIALYDAESE